MMLLDNMFYNHFDLMRPKVMVVSEKMYQEAQQKKLQARLDYLEEQKEHYEKLNENNNLICIEGKGKMNKNNKITLFF